MPALPLAQTDTPASQAAFPTPQDPPPGYLPQQQAVPTGAAPAPQQAAPQQADPQQGAPQQPAPQRADPQQPQGVPTQPAQSGPMPRQGRPMLDPRPYAWLQENRPQDAALVREAADKNGVSPTRLAMHWYAESRMNDQSPDSSAGAQGPMQIIPTTAQQYDPQHVLDPKDLRSSLYLAGRIVHDLDNKYGQDTPSSVAAYHGGPGSADDISARPDAAEQNHPKTMAYVRQFFPGQQVTPGQFNGGMQMDPRSLVDAVKQGGPDGFLRIVGQTAQQSGTTMTDAMRSAEASLVGVAAARGDYAGMQHARDFMLQVSHAGANQYLMAAHQALSSGDSQSAAQYLAKAHAFVPDGTSAQFGVDTKGQLWGQRLDEHTGKPMGGPFQVTPDGVAGLLNQTTNPGQYLNTVMEQQKNAAYSRHLDSMGQYYANLLDARHQDVQTKADAQVTSAGKRADATVDAAAIRTQGRQGQGPAAKISAQADKEAETLYNDVTMPDKDALTRGQMAEVYHDVRLNGVTGPQAQAVTDGVMSGSLQLAPGRDGSYGVMNPKDKSGKPIAILSKSLGDRLAGNKAIERQPGAVPGSPQQQAAVSPVGAGAATPMARATGVTSDLSGTRTQQPTSALPVS